MPVVTSQNLSWRPLTAVHVCRSVCACPIPPYLLLDAGPLRQVTVRELIARGLKVFRGVSAEAMSALCVGMWLVWESNALDSARLNGYRGGCVDEAVKYMLRVLDEAGSIQIIGKRDLYLYQSGVPGVPELIARMARPSRILRSREAWNQLPAVEQKHHWLGTTVCRRGKDTPLWQAYPFLLLGDAQWESIVPAVGPVTWSGAFVVSDDDDCVEGDAVEFGACDDGSTGEGVVQDAVRDWKAPAHEKYGRAGSAGGLFWLKVEQ